MIRSTSRPKTYYTAYRHCFQPSSVRSPSKSYLLQISQGQSAVFLNSSPCFSLSFFSKIGSARLQVDCPCRIKYIIRTSIFLQLNLNMSNDFDENKYLIMQIVLAVVGIALLVTLLYICKRVISGEQPQDKKTLELNEQQFQNNIQMIKKNENVIGGGKNDVEKFYEHFNEEEYVEGVPKRVE